MQRPDPSAARYTGAAAEERVVIVGGSAVRVVLRGNGPPLLMLNGIGAHVAMWEPLAAELAPGHRLVMFDAPGTGMTAPLPRPLRMPGLALFVVQLMDALGLKRVDLLGYSWGGVLAQQVAHDAPHRVRRLVLASTTPGLGGQPPSLRTAATMLTPARFTSSSRARVAAARIYGGDYRSPGGHHKALRQWNAHPPTLVGYTQQLYAISGWTSLPWLRRLRAPTLVISGQDDPLVPTLNAHLLARLIPQAQLHLVPGGGHLWLLDHASEGSTVIRRFLAPT